MFNFKNKYGQFVDVDLEERKRVGEKMNAEVWEFIARNSLRKDELLAKKKKGKITDAEEHELQQKLNLSLEINKIFPMLKEGNILGAISLDEQIDKKFDVKLFRLAA